MRWINNVLLILCLIGLSCRIAERANPFDPDGEDYKGPVISGEPNSHQRLTEGESISLSVYANGSDLRYRWQKNQMDIPFATSYRYSKPSASISDSGRYRCIVENNWGADTSRMVFLEVEQNAPEIIVHPISKVIDEGSFVTLSVSAQGPSREYSWRKNGQNIYGASSSNYTIYAAELSDNGEYQCIVSNSGGSVESETAVLSVHANHDYTLFYDGFTSNANGWFTGTASDSTYEFWISNGYYYLEYNYPQHMRRSTISNPSFTAAGDYSIETEIEHLSGDRGSPFGLTFCADYEDYYRFVIYDDGHFKIQRHYSDEWSSLQAWTQCDAVNIYSENVLKITKSGGYHYFFINEQWVATKSVSPCYGNRFGFNVSQKMRIRCNYIRIRD